MEHDEYGGPVSSISLDGGAPARDKVDTPRAYEGTCRPYR